MPWIFWIALVSGYIAFGIMIREIVIYELTEGRIPNLVKIGKYICQRKKI